MRDLMYVEDAVDAFLIMGEEKKAIGEALNFGTGKDTRILNLAEKIIEISKSSSKIVHLKPREAEVGRLCCNPSKAFRLFQWGAKTSLEEGLRKSVAWARENRSASF